MIDLHVHSTNSDGQYSVKEILKMAEMKKINTISFCDHDVLGAYEELKNMDVSQYFTGTIIPGIEFSVKYKNNLYHLLGYKFNVDEMLKSKYLMKLSQEEILKREKENLEFFKKVCKSLNIVLSDDLEITKINYPANDVVKDDMIKHKENEEVLNKVFGIERPIRFYRKFVTNPDSPFFIDFTKNLPDIKEIANEIHKYGGIVVLPHVFEYNYENLKNEQFLKEIYEMGILDGIECVHSKHNEMQVEFLTDFCKRHNLFMSGGSDFHTDKSHNLGYTNLGEILDKFCLKKA